MSSASNRESKFSDQYREMAQYPAFIPDIGVIDLTTFHLHHLSRYILRLEGFSTHFRKPLSDFLDTDLGGCLLGCLPVIEEYILNIKDLKLNKLWHNFIAETDRFRAADQTLKPENLQRPFNVICSYLHFIPRLHINSEQGAAANP